MTEMMVKIEIMMMMMVMILTIMLIKINKRVNKTPQTKSIVGRNLSLSLSLF